jgi:hypothetical protein
MGTAEPKTKRDNMNLTEHIMFQCSEFSVHFIKPSYHQAVAKYWRKKIS